MKAPIKTGMNTHSTIKSNRETHVAKSRAISAGEVFADGTMVELISPSPEGGRPHLLLWNGKKATTGSTVKRHGLVYQAPELAPSVYRAVRLPSGITDYGSARGLFTEITDLFVQNLDFRGQESGLLACFAISTWVADRLPMALCLAISGPLEETGIDLLRLLSCICRHSLMLAEVTRSGLRSLPMQLSPTLLINQPELKPGLQRLFRASRHRGLHSFSNGGRLVDLYGSKATFCRSDAPVDSLGAGVIDISVAPSRAQPSSIGEQLLNKIADSFQRSLLMYRLKNLGKVSTPQIDVSTFTLASQNLARSVAACFPEDSQLARDAVDFLLPHDEEIRAQRLRDVIYAIIEILCAIARSGTQREVQVDELTKQVNVLLRSRGEMISYSPEQIGWKLKTLNIRRHSSSDGRKILLERSTKDSLERLALAYDFACSESASRHQPPQVSALK